MQCPPVFADEDERLAALATYGLSTERALATLDPVVQIAARMFNMPVAAVNMIGRDHVFFAASTGMDPAGVDMSRDVSFCAHAIARQDVMVVPDAIGDDRFHDNPLVTGPAQLRFYAGVPLRSPDGKALGALCVIDNKPRPDFSAEDAARLCELARMAQDRLELRRLEISTETARRPFEELAQNSPTAVAWLDANGSIVSWNDAAARLFQYAPTAGKGLTFDALLTAASRPGFRSLLDAASRQRSADGLIVPGTLQGLRSDGLAFELGLSLFCWSDTDELVFNVHLEDNTAHRRYDDERATLAHTDALTGLPNRIMLYRCTEECLRSTSAVTMLLVDIDGFKDVNATLGHQVGDRILQEVARRMCLQIGTSGTVARIGGDEFAVLLPGVSNHDEVLPLAGALIELLAAPCLVDGHEVRIAASCGLACSPEHAMEALELISSADLALYKAKSIGRSQCFLFVKSLHMEAVARRLYNMELHRALSDGEFVLFYQPQIRLQDGALVGAEALLRWRHPQRGLLSPAAFLPALENGPLAAPAGFWVLDEACAQAAFWRRRGLGTLRIGVNLFGAQFRVGNFVEQVLATLARHGLPPEALELEITENIVLNHDDVALLALRRLRDHGIGIAFDDFGTGYASLSLLKRYPLSRIKVDRSFVQGLLGSEQDTALVRTILDLSRSFRLESIAEGVEVQQQYDLLLEFGYEEGQGYLFGRPVPAADFEQRLALLTSRCA